MLISRHVFIVARCQLDCRNEAGFFDCGGQTGQTNHLNDFLLFLLQLLHLEQTHTKLWFSLLDAAHGAKVLYWITSFRTEPCASPLLPSPNLIKQWASTLSQRHGKGWQKTIYLSVPVSYRTGQFKAHFSSSIPTFRDKSHTKWDQRFPLSYCLTVSGMPTFRTQLDTIHQDGEGYSI